MDRNVAQGPIFPVSVSDCGFGSELPNGVFAPIIKIAPYPIQVVPKVHPHFFFLLTLITAVYLGVKCLIHFYSPSQLFDWQLPRGVSPP